MTTPDPRREATPSSDSGWLQRQVAQSVASLDSLPPKLRASLTQPTTRRRHHMTTINDETVRAAIDAAFPGLPAGMTLDEAERRMRAGLAAVVPLIRAQVQAEADAREERAWHRGFESARRHARITPAVPRTFAAPVTVRIAEDFHEPDEPVADVQAAFEAGEKGVTKRPDVRAEPVEPCGSDIGVFRPRRCVLPRGHGGDWHDDGSACWSTSLEPVEPPEGQERSEENES